MSGFKGLINVNVVVHWHENLPETAGPLVGLGSDWIWSFLRNGHVPTAHTWFHSDHEDTGHEGVLYCLSLM